MLTHIFLLFARRNDGAQIIGMYFLSTVFLLRKNLPNQYRSIVSRVLGDVSPGLSLRYCCLFVCCCLPSVRCSGSVAFALIAAPFVSLCCCSLLALGDRWVAWWSLCEPVLRFLAVPASSFAAPLARCQPLTLSAFVRSARMQRTQIHFSLFHRFFDHLFVLSAAIALSRVALAQYRIWATRRYAE